MRSSEFLERVVTPNVNACFADIEDLRLAVNACFAIDALAGIFYVENAGTPQVFGKSGRNGEGKFRADLRRMNLAYDLVETAAWCVKHGELTREPRVLSSIQDVAFKEPTWNDDEVWDDRGIWEEGAAVLLSVRSVVRNDLPIGDYHCAAAIDEAHRFISAFIAGKNYQGLSHFEINAQTFQRRNP